MFDYTYLFYLGQATHMMGASVKTLIKIDDKLSLSNITTMGILMSFPPLPSLYV